MHLMLRLGEVKKMRNVSWLLTGLSVAAVAAMGVVVGCTSTDSSESAEETPKSDVCPTTVENGTGTACHTANFSCQIAYACSEFTQNAICVCDGTSFTCTDQTGATVDKGSQPQCTPWQKPHAGDCPATEPLANLAKCKSPGLQCTYPNGCPVDPVTKAGSYDTCLCENALLPDGGVQFQFTCIPQCPNVDGGVIDVGVPDTFVPPDAKGDALAD
jgi:hypothetical protein